MHIHTMSRGKQYSLIMHALLLLAMIVGLPNFLHRQPESEPMAISVEILPVAPVSNVKPQEQVEQPKEKKAEAPKVTDRKAHVEARKPEPKPEEKPELVSAKDIIKKLEKEKKPEKPVKKPKEDLDSILKSVEESAKTEESKKPTQAKQPPAQTKAVSDHYNEHAPLSLSEMDAIGQQVAKCWNPPVGAKDAASLIVNLHIRMNADGSVSSVDLASSDLGRYSSDSFFRAAADAAKRAVRECSPLKSLPADKYSGSNGWGDMDFTFDPSKFS